MPAVTTNLTGEYAIEQGAEWAHGWAVTYNGVPLDETWTAAAQIRFKADSADPLGEFGAEVDADGNVVIGVTAAESSAWTWSKGVYDVEVTNADESVTLRVAEGRVDLSPEVTR